jgi:type I restriction enzyme, S subunit
MGKTIRLGDHCTKIGSGATPRGGKDSYLQSGPYTLIRSQNIYNDTFAHNGLAFISQVQADALRNAEVLSGDVLLNITDDSVARACQVVDDVLPARVNQHVAIIRPKTNAIDTTFLRYFLVTPEMQGRMLGLASAGATRPALTKGMIENFQIPAMGIPEQRTIAAILSALDDKIELNRRMNGTLERQARALFRDWFVDFGPTRAKMAGARPYLAPEIWSLFPERLDDDGVPEGWEERLLGGLAHNHSETMNLKKRERVIFVNTGDVLEGRFLHEDYSDVTNLPGQAKKRIEQGDLLFSEIRPKNKRFAFVNFDAPDHVVSTKFMVIRTNGEISPTLLYFILKQREVISEFNTVAESRSGTFPQITFDSIKHYPVIWASGRLRDEFEKIYSSILSKQDAHNSESHTLAQTRDLLLPKLMSGEIRVRDAEQIAEAVL